MIEWVYGIGISDNACQKLESLETGCVILECKGALVPHKEEGIREVKKAKMKSGKFKSPIDSVWAFCVFCVFAAMGSE